MTSLSFAFRYFVNESCMKVKCSSCYLLGKFFSMNLCRNLHENYPVYEAEHSMDPSRILYKTATGQNVVVYLDRRDQSFFHYFSHPL